MTFFYQIDEENKQTCCHPYTILVSSFFGFPPNVCIFLIQAANQWLFFAYLTARWCVLCVMRYVDLRRMFIECAQPTLFKVAKVGGKRASSVFCSSRSISSRNQLTRLSIIVVCVFPRRIMAKI